MRRAAKKFSLGLLVVAMTACTTLATPAPPKDYLDKALAGYIDGKAWTYKHAYVDPTIDTPDDEDLVVVFLPFKPAKTCEPGAVDRDGAATVMVATPNSQEAFMLKRGTRQTLVFQFRRGKKPWVVAAKKGKMQLTATTPTRIEGKILAVYNGKNWVSGRFSAEVCAYQDMLQHHLD